VEIFINSFIKKALIVQLLYAMTGGSVLGKIILKVKDMTTKQLLARVRKYYREKGSISLQGMEVPEMTQGAGNLVQLDRLCEDDGELGVMCVGEKWFIPLNELTYRELAQILKRF
jgi:hypothetical protein